MAKPVPIPTPETLPYWQACKEGRIEIQFCGRCDSYFFYPRAACPSCGLGDEVEWRPTSGRARLVSYVIQHIKAPGYDTPFVIAIVELEEGVRMLSNLVKVAPEPEAIEAGMELTVEFESREEWAVPVFAPASS